MKTAQLKILIIFLFNIIYVNTIAQIQLGNDINGNNANDGFGVSVSMADSANFAVGASGGSFVTMYSYNGTNWIKRGNDIVGETINDQFGHSVSMPDLNSIGIGGIRNDNNGLDAGHAKVFCWNGSNWQQKGNDIQGDTAGDWLGYAVSMPDENTIGVSAIDDIQGGSSGTGYVKIFTWNGTDWIQKGATINGANVGDRMGWAISMPNANFIAIGAIYNSNNNGSNSGLVRVFSWNGNNWQQQGLDINGDTSNDYLGSSVFMPDSITLAVGAPYNDDNGSESGQVRVYNWDGVNWVQKGNDINGNSSGDIAGHSISMPDKNTIAIGAPLSNDNGIEAGQVRVFKWNGNSWVQKGNDLNGESSEDFSGVAVCMPDSNTVCIGAPGDDGNGSNSGHVRVFSFVAINNLNQRQLDETCFIFPNPTSTQLTIKSVIDLSANIEISDHLGKLYQFPYKREGRNLIVDTSQLAPGLYILKVTDGVRTFSEKVLIKR